MDFIPLFVLCPESFFLTLCIVDDHLIGCVKDVLGRTVILLQAHHLSFRENLLKSQNVPDISPAETINGLVIITNNAEILVFLSKKAYEFKLCCICILILIYHDITETLLIIFQYIFLRLEKLHRLKQQIVKI